jgi:predicted metal-dependent phosphoesterase TrpH
VYTVDLHTHTRFFHGHRRAGDVFDPIGVRMLAGMARIRGLDGFATTNHDYAKHFSVGGPVEVIPGIEITTTDGHLLVVGPDPPLETEPGELTPTEAVEIAHERGRAAIVAHPHRNSTVREADAGFDAIEINGKGMDHQRVRDLAERLDLALVGGSDAHYPIEVARAFTRVEADELTPESVVAAIKDGDVKPYLHHSPAQRALRTVYKAIHTQKGWLERPTPPGVGKPPGEDEPASELEEPEQPSQ